MTATNAFKEDASIGNRYLADQLDDAERAAFEAYLVENPAALEELEATARLKVGLHRLRTTGELSRLLQPPRGVRQPWIMAMAAAVGMVVIAVGLLRWNPTSTSPMLSASLASLADENGRGLQIAKTYTLLQTRNESYDAVIELPASPHAIELRILPDRPVPGQQYRVSISRIGDTGSTESVAALGALESAEDGFITVFTNSSQLSAGRYQLVLTREDAQGADTVDSYELKATSSQRESDEGVTPEAE